MYEGADEFVFSHLGKFKDKDIVSGDRDDLELGDAPSSAEGEPLAKERVESLCGWIKDTLGAAGPKAVAAGDRLVGSPAVALNTDKYSTPGMCQMMRAMRKDDSPLAAEVKLELNPRHALVKQLDALRERDAERAKLVAEQLYDNALLAAGLLDNPRLMVARLNKLLESLAK